MTDGKEATTARSGEKSPFEQNQEKPCNRCHHQRRFHNPNCAVSCEENCTAFVTEMTAAESPLAAPADARCLQAVPEGEGGTYTPNVGAWTCNHGIAFHSSSGKACKNCTCVGWAETYEAAQESINRQRDEKRMADDNAANSSDVPHAEDPATVGADGYIDSVPLPIQKIRDLLGYGGEGELFRDFSDVKAGFKEMVDLLFEVFDTEIAAASLTDLDADLEANRDIDAAERAEVEANTRLREVQRINSLLERKTERLERTIELAESEYKFGNLEDSNSARLVNDELEVAVYDAKQLAAESTEQEIKAREKTHAIAERIHSWHKSDDRVGSYRDCAIKRCNDIRLLIKGE